MSEQFVVFLTPTLSEGFCSEFVESYERALRLLDKAGIRHERRKAGGDPFISHARNGLSTEFLKDFPDATDAFWWDDDVGAKASKVMEFLARDDEIVVGSPPKKTTQVDWPVDLCVDPRTGELVERDGLLKAALVPLGFVRMKRSVLAKLASRSFVFREPISDSASREVYSIFEDGVIDGRIYEEANALCVRASHDENHHWGEDQVFCLKWHHLGGEIWLDPDCIFSHRGRAIWIASFSKNLPYFREHAREAFAKPVRAAE